MKRKLRIAVVYQHGQLDVEAMRARKSPSDISHGAFELEEIGHSVDYIGVSPWSSDGGNKSNFKHILVKYMLNSKTTLGHIEQARKVLEGIKDKYDIVFSIPTKMSLAFAVQKHLMNLQIPIVGVQTGMMNRADNIFRKRSISLFLKDVVSIVLGRGEYDEIKKRYNLSDHYVEEVLFGVDREFWEPDISAHSRSDYVLSIGNDNERDFYTLIEAVRSLSCRVKLVTRHKFAFSLPSNIEVVETSLGKPILTFMDIKKLYQSAACLVTPVKNTIQPSGQSSTMQAMACATPVIITDYIGLWSKDQIKNNETALLVPPYDITAMRNAIELMITNRKVADRIGNNSRKMVELVGNSRISAQKLDALFSRIVERGGG